MTAIATPPPHQVLASVMRARESLSAVAGERPWSMSPSDTAETLAQLEALEAQTTELKSRVLTHATAVDLPAESGATSTANWLAHRHRVTRLDAHRQQWLAQQLESHEPTRTALAEGRVHVEQANAILRGLTSLPEGLDSGLVKQAEEHLLELAGDFDAKGLKNLSRKLLEVVAPDEADAHEAKLLEQEERDNEAANRINVWTDSRGRLQGRFTLDGFSGACFTKALLALAAPKHRASRGPLGERKPTPERLGRAFAEYVRRCPASKLPKAGGMNAAVVVLLDYATLMGGLKAAKLDTGETISASLARRIACQAGIIPAVLGGKSEVLDLGRSRRFHSRAQRIVATVDQGGCIAQGCDAPPGMTQMHHSTPWAEGGETNTRELWMLCPLDHRRAHDPGYTHERMPNGKVRFHRRT